MSDLLGSSFNPSASIPMITSVAGDTLFCDGQSTTPLAVIPGNLSGVSCGEGAAECGVRQAMAQSFLSFASGLNLVQADNAISQNAYAVCQRSYPGRVFDGSARYRLPGQQSVCHAAATDRSIDAGAQQLWSESPDLLCRRGELRHPCEPVRPAERCCWRRFLRRCLPSTRRRRSWGSRTR